MKQELRKAAIDFAKKNPLLIFTRMEAFAAGATWRDRQLNWIRDLAKAGIDKPEEAVNILKRIDGLLND